MNNVTHALQYLKTVGFDSPDKEPLDALQACLTHGVKFLLPANGDVGVDLTQAALSLVRSPYPVTVFEWDMSKDGPLDPSGRRPDQSLELCTKRIAVVVDPSQLVAGRGIGNILDLYTLYYYDSTGSWAVSPVSLSVDLDGKFEFFEGVLGCDVLARDLLPSICARAREHQFLDSIVSDMSDELNVVLRALACLNARNVKEVLIPAPEKLNRKRVRSGSTPFFEYHILDIFLGSKVREVSSSKRGAAALASVLSGGASLKLHAVRGHFKVRKTGLFWWKPFFRGDQNKGVVDKDYAVHP